MANAITLAKTFIPILDKIYKQASLTSVLDGNPELVRQGASYNEMIIPKISMQGLADYSRNGGYVNGDVTLTNETVRCNFDRGRMFQVDTMDNLETAGIAFGQLSGEFLRTKVVRNWMPSASPSMPALLVSPKSLPVRLWQTVRLSSLPCAQA